jgi:hypothetical protein
MPPHEVAMYLRFLRLSRKFDHLPQEEREALAFEELERELAQEREERRRRVEYE